MASCWGEWSAFMHGGRPLCGDSLLNDLGGLHGLARACSLDLSRLRLTPSQGAALLATVELGRRLARAEVPERHPLEPSPEVLARYLSLRYGTGGQEVMGALFISARGDVLHEAWFFKGTLHRCSVEPAPLLKVALSLGAAGLILFHSHPSADPRPSREDIAFTRRMARACEVMGVEFLDHLIVAYGGGWVSLRERVGW